MCQRFGLKKIIQIFSFPCSLDFHEVSVWLSFRYLTVVEMGHKKIFMNVMTEAGHKYNKD